MSQLQDLPVEVEAEILASFTPNQITEWCIQRHPLCRDDKLWRAIIVARWPQDRRPIPTNARQEYIRRYRQDEDELFRAVSNNNLDKVTELVERGIDANFLRRGDTPLTLAVFNDNISIVEMLIRYASADLDLANGSGSTPLIVAAKHGRRDILELLLEYGADPNKQNQLGLTALHMLVRYYPSNFSMFENLLAAGADPEIANSNGSTATKEALAKSRFLYNLLKGHKEDEEVIEGPWRPYLVNPFAGEDDLDVD